MKDNISIIYMGTPEFAVLPLKSILKSEIQVKAVVTATDKPAGRGKKIQMSAVKSYALSQNITVLQPENLKDPVFIDQLKSFDADIFVVIAFRMLPKLVWEIPEKGTFNIHGSLLPNYRGAAPINWAIINGESLSGVTSFMINEEIDSGSVIDKREVEILNTDTASDLHDKLMIKASELVVDTIHQIIEGNIKLNAQLLTGNEKPAPKLFKNNCEINWDQSVENLYNFIRGLSPYPGAWSYLYKDEQNQGTFKIYKSSLSHENSQRSVGEIYSEAKTIKIVCSNGVLNIDEIQWPGKKRMDSASFLNGFKLDKGWSVRRIR